VNLTLFDYPGTHGFMKGLTHAPVGAPLAGGDLYITDAEFERYIDAVLDVWSWLGSQLKGKRWTIRK